MPLHSDLEEIGNGDPTVQEATNDLARPVCCALALIAACQSPGDGGASGDREGALDITSSDPASIEARYREGEHAVVLRSQRHGAVVRSEILDDRGRSVTQLASSIIDRRRAGKPVGSMVGSSGGPAAVPVLFDHARQLGAALRMSRHAVRQLRDAVGADTAGSQVFQQLQHQTDLLHTALRHTRLDLLQAWGSEARNHISMTPDEHTRFFAILGRHAQAIAQGPTATRRTAAGTGLGAELEALLGPERYAQYRTERKAWLARIGDDAAEVVP